MSEQRRNSYYDDDLRQVIEEIEEYEDQATTIRAEAAGKCSGIAKKIANAKKNAKALNIPLAILSATLKTRKLERELQKVADGVPDELTEMWEDASGQFSLFAPEPGEEQTKAPAAAKAASKRKAAAKANQEAEQKEGAAVLSTLAGGKPN